LNGHYKWIALGLALGALFLWMSVRDTDFGAVVQILESANYAFVVGVVAASACFIGCKAFRWGLILKPVAHPGFPFLHNVTYVGTAANLTIPHSGEILRSSLVATKANIPASPVLASIGIERLLDFATVVVMMVILLIIQVQFRDAALATNLLMAGVIAMIMVAIGICVSMLVLFPSRIRALLSRVLWGNLPPFVMAFISDQVEKGRTGMQVLGSPAVLFRVMLVSVLQWSFIIAAIWMSGAAVGHAPSIPGAITVWVMMVIGLTLPSSPAQLGTTQLAYALGYGLAGGAGSEELALAASAVYTCGVNALQIVAGLLCWLWSKRVDSRNGAYAQ
jgi:glycosyltransferase 2 family protein